MIHDWKERQRQMARARTIAKLNRLNAPISNFRKPHTRKKDFIKALPGTCGVLSHIAKRLGVNHTTVTNLLERPEWDDVRALWLDECKMGEGAAEEALHYAIKQRLDLGISLKASTWVLERQPGGKYAKVNPLAPAVTINNNNLSIDMLNLPIEMKRAILQAIKEKEGMAEGEVRVVRQKIKQLPASMLDITVPEEEEEEMVAVEAL